MIERLSIQPISEPSLYPPISEPTKEIPMELLPFTKEQRLHALNLANWRCEFNGCERGWDDGWMLEIHHIVPESHGGEDVIDNAQVLCLDHHAVVHEDLGMWHAAELIRERMDRSEGGKQRKYLHKQ